MHGILNVRMGQRKMKIRVNPERKSTPKKLLVDKVVSLADRSAEILGAIDFLVSGM